MDHYETASRAYTSAKALRRARAFDEGQSVYQKIYVPELTREEIEGEQGRSILLHCLTLIASGLFSLGVIAAMARGMRG